MPKLLMRGEIQVVSAPRLLSGRGKLLLCCAFFGLGIGQASAEVTIAERATQHDMTVRITNDTRQAVIDKIAKTLEFKVTGQVANGEPVTAVMRGDLKSITGRLLGENAVTLVYGPNGVEELIVVNSFDNPQKPVGVVKVDPPLEKAAAGAVAVEPAVKKQAADVNGSGEVPKVRVVGDTAKVENATAAVPEADPGPPASMFTDVDNETMAGFKKDGKPIEGDDMESLAKRSEASLNELTKALQSLCPPDQKCR